MIEILTGAFALLLIFFLPGFFLTLAIFPKRGALDMEFDLLFKGILGIAISLLIAISVGILLNEIGDLTQGSLLQSVPLWISLSLVTVISALIAWIRGGLQEFIVELRGSTKAIISRGSEAELSLLAYKKKELLTKLAQLESNYYQQDEALKQEAAVRIPALRKEIKELSSRIDALLDEEERTKDGEADEEAG